jgi:hypothetical protein
VGWVGLFGEPSAQIDMVLAGFSRFARKKNSFVSFERVLEKDKRDQRRCSAIYEG